MKVLITIVLVFCSIAMVFGMRGIINKAPLRVKEQAKTAKLVGAVIDTQGPEFFRNTHISTLVNRYCNEDAKNKLKELCPNGCFENAETWILEDMCGPGFTDLQILDYCCTEYDVPVPEGEYIVHQWN